MSLGTRMKNAWVAWREKDDLRYTMSSPMSSGYRPHQTRTRIASERTLLASVIMRIAIDVASVKMVHAKVNNNGRYTETMTSELQNCLSFEANIDQPGRSFRQDVVETLLSEGVVAIVPVETTDSPVLGNAWDVMNLRVGRVVEWQPAHVVVELYNEFTGLRDQIRLPKKMVAIVDNPLYKVMNEPNSTLQRLTRKLTILDVIDEQSGSGRMDLIIQLPYTIKSDARRLQAENRRKDIEVQLSNSKYGIAYADATEKITQLNRPVENNLLKQVDSLTEMLYGQLGVTPAVQNGTAPESEMLNYYNRTVEPILAAITDAMTQKFLSKTARTQGQRIMYLRDPFSLAEVTTIAEIADKFTRNEIMSANEIRSVVGLQPSSDPKADELRNSNMPAPEPTVAPAGNPTE